MSPNCAIVMLYVSQSGLSYKVELGAKQGTFISPVLFSCYMDKLFKQLKRNGIGCHVDNIDTLFETRMV